MVALRELAETAGCLCLASRRAGELAHKVGADRTTLTRNLALVAEQGFVRIREGDDARARIVTITPKGRAILRASFATWRKVQAGLTDMIGSQAADGLRRLARSTSPGA